MAHKHSVRDMGAHFLIDQFTRQIKNDSINKTTIVQYDHNSERLTFELPLYVDGHAMTLCDLIEIHYINISTDGNSQNHGTYEVNDIKAEGEKAVFTWLISQECTQLAGSLNFFIVFKCTENGVTVYRWGTEIYKNLPISAGMDNGEAIVTEYPDILAQWKAQIFGAQDASVLAVEAAKETALAAIESAGEAKKQSVLDSIPDEYEALSALADQNHRNKAGAIVLEEEGESIVLNDASEYPLQNLKVFGKSTQDGTPTPDAPVDIVNANVSEIVAFGGNLIPYPYKDGTSKTMNGITYTVNEDGSILVNGTATDNSNFTLSASDEAVKLPKGWVSTSLGIGFGSDIVQIQNDIFCDGVYLTTIQNQLEKSSKRFFETNVEFRGSRIKVASGVTVNNVLVYPVFCCSENAIPYEMGAEKQAVALSYTLPGIPVSSGGNYTDENGQEWICDEVDLARGVYVQRVVKKTFSASVHEAWRVYKVHPDKTHTAYQESKLCGDMMVFAGTASKNAELISNKFAAVPLTSVYDGGTQGISVSNVSPAIRMCVDACQGCSVDEFKAWLSENPFELMYPLATPIETAMSDAEINAFRALHSNRPNTVILNDAGAHMAVSYVADTKTYIDNKIKELMEGVTE